MCLEFETGDKPFSEGVERTLYKVLILKDGKLISPVFSSKIWLKGYNYSNRPSLSLGHHEVLESYVANGIHVLLTMKAAEEWACLYCLGSIARIVKVECRDSECVMVSLNEAVYMMVHLSQEEYERAIGCV